MIFSPNRSHFGASSETLRSFPHIEGVSLGKGHPFIHVARANRLAAAGREITVKG
jgi:hypothetical protein